jgi:hypothetical protein
MDRPPWKMGEMEFSTIRKITAPEGAKVARIILMSNAYLTLLQRDIINGMISPLGKQPLS